MGILTETQQGYYEGNDHGNYQFVSIKDIINQFMITYVGEEKLITRARKIDVAFHAQRGLAEFSFDTFKSVKSQEILLPPSLTMILPQDYVNYVKVSWSDDAGIKHNLYPTSKTSNPLKIKQEDDGEYLFVSEEVNILQGGDVDTNIDLTNWTTSNTPPQYYRGQDVIEISGERLAITSYPSLWSGNSLSYGREHAVWQELDVSNTSHLSISAIGERAAAAYQGTSSSGNISNAGVITFGITTQVPNGSNTNPLHPVNTSINNKDIYDLTTLDGDPSYVIWDESDTAATASYKTKDLIDVTSVNTVYAVVTSTTMWNGGTEGFADWTKDNGSVLTNGVYGSANVQGVDPTIAGNSNTNYIDALEVQAVILNTNLQTSGDSTTWTNYKSQNSSDDANPEIYSYDSNIYDYNIGERYGLDPQHAQVNGSFYIDELRGKIHFSSNISGKTVILDYISDSLGTDEEMRVHKFAEEAMYKWIAHGLVSTMANIPEYVINRYKRERFATTRQAKLRLSNIKLEDITQVLRGKSKHIKH